MIHLCVNLEEYWKIQKKCSELTVLYPALDRSQFIEWLKKEYKLEGNFTDYKLEVHP